MCGSALSLGCSWELLETGASAVCLLGAEGRDGDRGEKKTLHWVLLVFLLVSFFFFSSGAQKRISRKIA